MDKWNFLLEVFALHQQYIRVFFISHNKIGVKRLSNHKTRERVFVSHYMPILLLFHLGP